MDGAHDRGTCRHGAAAQIVAETEPTRENRQIEISQIGLLVPDHPRFMAGGSFQRDGHVALSIDAGKDDDAGFHCGLDSSWHGNVLRSAIITTMTPDAACSARGRCATPRTASRT